MAELKRKLAQEKLEALKKTAVGARVFADVTVEVCFWSQHAHCLPPTPGSYQLPFSRPPPLVATNSLSPAPHPW